MCLWMGLVRSCANPTKSSMLRMHRGWRPLSKTGRYTVAKVGRNRKIERTPTGRPSRAGARMDVPPAMIRAIRLQAAEHARRNHVVMGAEITRLMVEGKLTDVQVSAATSFAAVYQLWCRVLGIPSPNARAQVIGEVHGESGDVSPSAVEYVKKRMTDPATGAESILSKREYDALVFVAVRDRAAIGQDLAHLERGLDKLCEAWGLTFVPKSARNSMSRGA